MAKIICMTTGLTGILHASFEVVARLEAAGHELIYACPQDVGEKVRAQGFTYMQLPEVVFDPAPELPTFTGALGRFRRIWIKISTARQRHQAAVIALRMEVFEKMLQELSPDLILLDMELHDHIITAVARQYRVALLSQWFSGWERPGLPPIHSSTIPGKGWQGHAWAIKGAWVWKKFRLWLDIQQGKWFSCFTDRRSILRSYAKSISFPIAELEQYNWPPPFTYKSLPVLSMTAWPLEFPHQPRPSMSYVGPMVYEKRIDTQTDPLLNDQLEQIFAQKKASGRPLIYCSVSTMAAGDQAFLLQLIKAMEKEPGWMMVLSLGGLLNLDFLQPIPPNVYPFAWVPQLRVLQAADCSINHGGIHTINECIHFRVPMLIYSGKRYDQNGCAARVAFHQMGIVADKDKDEALQIRERINQLLNNPSYQDKMDDLHGHYQENKNGLAEAVDQLLTTSRVRVSGPSP